MRRINELQDTKCCSRCKAMAGLCGKQWSCTCHTTALDAARTRTEAQQARAEMVRIWGHDGMGRG